MDHLPETAEADHSVRDDLIALGVSFLASLTRDSFVSIHRLVVAETERFPELGRLFYENGPARGVQRFTEYFERVIAAGRLPPNDPREVGQRLKDLVLSDVYTRRLWGVLGPLTEAELRDARDPLGGHLPDGVRLSATRPAPFSPPSHVAR